MYLLLADSGTAYVKPTTVPALLTAATIKKHDTFQRADPLLHHWTHVAHLSAPDRSWPCVTTERSDAQWTASSRRRQRRAAGLPLQRPAG